ncbi:MAG: hypothetical protein ACXWQR_02700 [Ktedonobacterales bacterium]
MMYQLVLKRRSTAGAWCSRPHLSTTMFAEVRAQYAEAVANMPDLIEAVVLEGKTHNEVDKEYDCYLAGVTYRGIDPSDDGIRANIEHAPLRADYSAPEAKSLHFALFTPDVIHGYTALMRRVRAGALGGPHDGE